MKTLPKWKQVRTEVAYEKQFLDSISELSLRMAGINSLDIAEEFAIGVESDYEGIEGIVN